MLGRGGVRAGGKCLGKGGVKNLEGAWRGPEGEKILENSN